MSQSKFLHRHDAGQRLGAALRARGDAPPDVVLGLPRGGVPVAAEVARALHTPLDVLPVRKLGIPGWPEVAMGAIGPGGVRVLNEELIGRLGLTPDAVQAVEAQERRELARRLTLYLGGRPPRQVRGQRVVVVDDGLATGASMEAALAVLRAQGPAHLLVAVPVGAPDTVARLRAQADELLCLQMPAAFQAVGAFYDDFSQTSDAEVRALLAADRAAPDAAEEPQP
ncbi:phosphoribosyltransferase [Deinococcus navajonensis]|uniref:Phosphoribosyltransferase n=1 Tax=Deinococcus navajonensis TaxID=309884 RepID=A0ABV8XHA1_9DEIO